MVVSGSGPEPSQANPGKKTNGTGVSLTAALLFLLAFAEEWDRDVEG
jgi:hypothetical protein